MNPPKDNTIEVNPTPSEPPVNKGGDKDKSESSTSDTRSSAENYANPFVLLELEDNISVTMSKVESLDKSVAQIDSKIDAKVSSLDTKLDAILHSLSEMKKVGPLDAEWA